MKSHSASLACVCAEYVKLVAVVSSKTLQGGSSLKKFLLLSSSPPLLRTEAKATRKSSLSTRFHVSLEKFRVMDDAKPTTELTRSPISSRSVSNQ